MKTLQQTLRFGAHWLSLVLIVFGALYIASFMWGGFNTRALTDMLQAHTFFVWPGLGGTVAIAIVMQTLNKNLKQTWFFGMHWLSLVTIVFAITTAAFFISNGFNTEATKNLLAANGWFLWIGLITTAVVALILEGGSYKPKT